MFAGFDQEALRFLTDMRLNNHQAFYENNKERYEQAVKAPLRALSDEMIPIVQGIDPKLDIRPGRTMSRIRRDTRFSKDKSPFRDHVWLGWRYPGESRSEGFGMFWGFGPDWLAWGAGCYATDKPLMDALRGYIRQHPDEVREALAPVRRRYVIYGEDYKKIAVPSDVPEDLRMLYVKKGFGIEHQADQEEWKMLHTHAMADLLARELLAMAPLQQLMQRVRAQAAYLQEAQDKQEKEAQRKQMEAEQPRKTIVARSASEYEF